MAFHDEYLNSVYLIPERRIGDNNSHRSWRLILIWWSLPNGIDLISSHWNYQIVLYPFRLQSLPLYFGYSWKGKLYQCCLWVTFPFQKLWLPANNRKSPSFLKQHLALWTSAQSTCWNASSAMTLHLFSCPLCTSVCCRFFTISSILLYTWHLLCLLSSIQFIHLHYLSISWGPVTILGSGNMTFIKWDEVSILTELFS